MLPPAAALEREIEQLGVASKQEDRARQVFERSAEQAGPFELGRNRLVEAGIAGGGGKPADDDKNRNGGGGGDGTGDGDMDPLLVAFIQELPKAGEKFDAASGATWLQMVAMAFPLAYGPEAEIAIKANANVGG